MAARSKLKKYWTLSAQHKFLERFTQLVENGFSVAEALQVMETVLKAEPLRTMQAFCGQGTPFAATLEASGFESRTVYMIRCNEENGSLLLGLQKASDYSGNYLKNRRELSKKLRYPMFLLGTMFLVIGAIYLFFLPQLDSFYDSFNIEGDTSAIMGIVYVMGGFLLTVALAAVLLFYILHSRREQLGIFKLRISQKLFSYYFASQWQMLLACGLPLKDSLETIINFERTPLIKRAITKLKMQLETGRELEAVIADSPYFTAYFKLLMSHALKIGCAPKELSQFTKVELESLNQLVTGLFKGIQTGFLILIGSMIMLLYLSILQPVFEMVNII